MLCESTLSTSNRYGASVPEIILGDFLSQDESHLSKLNSKWFAGFRGREM